MTLGKSLKRKITSYITNSVIDSVTSEYSIWSIVQSNGIAIRNTVTTSVSITAWRLINVIMYMK